MVLALLAAVPTILPVAAGAPRRPTSPGGPQRAATGTQPRRPAPGPAVDYRRDILPILSANCYACHGPDDQARLVGLRFDRREEALKPRRTGSPITPGRPAASTLYARITAVDVARRMPPEKTGHHLTSRQIGLLRRWIEEGAPYAEHWAFMLPRPPRLPAVKNPGWLRNPIDAFVLARLEGAGMQPSHEADRATLIRRVSLDLTGLPPTPEEVRAFVDDPAADAYEKVVDRLLASPHFGERWARMWLDLARYADSAGYGSDPLRTNIWPYRDWVIAAFNRNLPYDQFTVEQLAGDLLPNPTTGQLEATAFHRNTMTNTEGGTDDEEFRVAAVKDRIATTAQVWMGLTMGCAQCHSHKYDPITQKEYYRFFACFNQTEDADRPDEAPTLPLPTAGELAAIERLKGEVESLQKRLAGAPAAEQPGLKEQLAAKQKELAAVKPVDLPILRELAADKQRTSYILIKGNFLNRGEKVEPGLPAAFPVVPGVGSSPDSATAGPRFDPPNRLGVARWLVSAENPLTARVAVNRFWAQLFGTGIVETEEDFGTQGALPSHPELLDWLALAFQRGRPAGGAGVNDRPASPWDVKALLRLMVTSATYRQSSQTTAEHLRRDPRNRLLARFPRRRLDAETVRDQALALSGLLSEKIGGPSVYPPQPDGLWRAAFNGQRTWPTSKGEDRYRRGLYTFWRRTVPYPSMATFDAPSREICTVRRVPTNTPLQSLVTLNDPAFVEMAQALGRRIVTQGGASTGERARFGLRLAMVREPTAEQVETLVRLFESERTRYRADGDAARKLATDPLGPLPAGMDAAEQAAWTVVANVLLNLDAVMTKS